MRKMRTERDVTRATIGVMAVFMELYNHNGIKTTKLQIFSKPIWG